MHLAERGSRNACSVFLFRIGGEGQRLLFWGAATC